MEIGCKNECRELVKIGLDKSLSYQKYMDLVSLLVAIDSNTGCAKTASGVGFTKLNQKRMNRWNKTLKVNEEVKDAMTKFNKNITWLVLTESWCGDAAHVIPAINKLAILSDNIDLRVILRDENKELMDNFLTEDTRSIPKLLMIDNETRAVIDSYGPRPKVLIKMVQEYKDLHGSVTPEFKEEIQKWYNKDKGKTVMDEIVSKLALLEL